MRRRLDEVTLMKTELVTTFKKRAPEIIARLQRGKPPVLITKHGKPVAYLVDVQSYNELNRRLSVVEGIAFGEQAIRDGRTLSHGAAKRRLSRWLS
jgi:prevent-host-death family protein